MACAIEVLFNDNPCPSGTIVTTVYEHISGAARIEPQRVSGYCDLPSGTYSIKLKRYRGTIGGAYASGSNSCTFHEAGWSNEVLKTQEVKVQ